MTDSAEMPAFDVVANVVGPQAAEQVLVALADAGYLVVPDGE